MQLHAWLWELPQRLIPHTYAEHTYNVERKNNPLDPDHLYNLINSYVTQGLLISVKKKTKKISCNFCKYR